MTTRKRVESWVVTDEFWRRVERFILVRERSAAKAYVRKAGTGHPPKPARQVFEAVVCVWRTGCQCKVAAQGALWQCQRRAQALPGVGGRGRVRGHLEAGLAEYDQMESIAWWAWQSIDGACSRLQWRKRRSDATRQIGEKGNKRHLLVGSRGVPSSLVVTGANEHDITQLDAVLQTILVKRKTPNTRRSKQLCADAGFRGRPALEIIVSHGYIPHVVDRGKEADAKRRDPTKKTRRWAVEVCHSWFNRFGKLLAEYEKLERSLVTLDQIAAAIIAFRKVPLKINIIYG